jgi:hypothetical protein
MSGYAAKLSAGVLLALTVTAGPAIAIEKPDSGSVGSQPSAMYADPPNYTTYDPQEEISPPVEEDSDLDATSVVLGALGGVALGGAVMGLRSRRRGWRRVRELAR